MGLAGIKTGDSGQWLLLGAMIVAVGMAVLIVFVNQSVLAGHSSSESIMDFPKDDIRDYRSAVVSETFLLGTEANARIGTLDGRESWFNASFDRFVSEARDIYSSDGTDVHVEYQCGRNESALPGGQTMDNVTLLLFYNNGDTQYNETTTVYLKG